MFTFTAWQLGFDEFESLTHILRISNVQSERMDLVGAVLLQVVLSLLRKTTGEHVASQPIQALREDVPESGVAPGDDDEALAVVADPPPAEQTTDDLIDDEDDDEEGETRNGAASHDYTEIHAHDAKVYRQLYAHCKPKNAKYTS